MCFLKLGEDGDGPHSEISMLHIQSTRQIEMVIVIGARPYKRLLYLKPLTRRHLIYMNEVSLPGWAMPGPKPQGSTQEVSALLQ